MEFVARVLTQRRSHTAFGVHLSPRALRQAAVRPSQPAPGVQVSRPVGRRETPPTGRRKSNRLSFRAPSPLMRVADHSSTNIGSS